MNDTIERIAEKVSPKRRLRMIVQLVGLAIGLGLLVYTVMLAFSEENRESLERLGQARAEHVLLVGGLIVVTVLLNGVQFWLTLWPVYRSRLLDVTATNAVCQLLTLLPFKISAVARVVIHKRRDGVPLVTITAWMTAFGAVTAAAIGPLVAASVWRGEIDTAWWLAFGLGTLALLGAMFATGRAFDGRRGHARLDRLVLALSLGPLKAMGAKAVDSHTFRRIYGVFTMLASPWAVFGGAVIRLGEMACRVVAVLIIARVIGLELSPEQATLVACVYFIVGSISPSGTLGLREGAVAALGLADNVEQQLATVALVLTAFETTLLLALGSGGAVYLRLRPGWSEERTHGWRELPTGEEAYSDAALEED